MTPPPVDAEELSIRRRSRATEMENKLLVLETRHAMLTNTVGDLRASIHAVEGRHDQLGADVAQIRSDNAVTVVKLDAIASGVTRLESARTKGGDRAWQAVALLIAAASSAVALISLATR